MILVVVVVVVVIVEGCKCQGVWSRSQQFESSGCEGCAGVVVC